MTHALEIRNLHIYYDSFHAVKDVSITIPTNTITAIIGASGCGKSSFLRVINRMNDLVPHARIFGEVFFRGVNIYDPSVCEIDLRRRMGMVFQKPNPFPFSIFDNVAFGLRIQNMRDKVFLQERVEESLRRCALWDEVHDRLHQSAYELSGGQQQRLCIARALAVYPDVLLLDEPCASLDPKATKRIEELLQKLKKEITIVIVTHNMQQARRISDYVAFFHAGELVEWGTSEEIFDYPKKKLTQEYTQGLFG